MRLSGRGLKCVRGGREVFSGLDFESAAGEALAVVGPNGSGKTSLLRLVAGLLHVEAGSIELTGGDAELTLPEPNKGVFNKACPPEVNEIMTRIWTEVQK